MVGGFSPPSFLMKILMASLFEKYVIILLATLILSQTGLWGQHRKGKRSAPDVVYCIDGSIYRGVIESYDFDTKLVLKVNDVTTISIPASSIEKVVQKESTSKPKLKDLDFKPKVEGWYHSSQLYGLGGYFANEFEVGLGIQHSFGYRWNQWVGAGVGVGYDNYLLANRTALIPVYAEFTGQLNDKLVAPIYTLQTGYGIGLNNQNDQSESIEEAKGGLFASGAIGIISYRPAGHAFTFEVGYRFQSLNYRRTFFWTKDFETYDILFKRLMIRFGIRF